MNHFSHPHQLELWSLSFQIQSSSTDQPSLPICSCCKLQTNEPLYFCMSCNFFIHFGCTRFPQLISHPSHKNHTLTLLPTAAYPGGAFNCDACNRQGKGFSYHCSSCEYDLHVGCAFKPLTITHQFHACPLELTFTKPYDNAKGFSCDVCHRIGFKEWLYRCGVCEFDVHLDCAAAAATNPDPPAAAVHDGGRLADPFSQNPVVESTTRYSSHGLFHQHQVIQSVVSMGGNTVAHHQFRPGNAAAEAVVHGQGQVIMRPNFVSRSSLMSSGVQGFVQGTNSQGVGQDFVHGMINGGDGGGGGGGDGLAAIFGDSSRGRTQD
ncbi:OLC1v1013773C1 [Oldenlandia corymbosa var. corymbosa]|uniref:OLC1v1013773C1 n=1 Tax=Oldenlandia corymbosa var. corymbosa TaxID=529605 RepID=A0AAV1E2P1_OLDCO|nr:OLC1v1013773C1 [Oldenlandia corymbosa var. corymbosa]